MRSLNRRDFVRTAGLGAASVAALNLAAACGSSNSASGSSKKHKIVLSNSYIGNQWRIEMENLYKAALLQEPYKSQVQGSVFNAGNTVSTQQGQISNMIAEHPDAILIDAASPTGLNGILEQAAGQGILVIAFDNTVTAKKALNVNTDQYQFGFQLADFLAKKLNGKGNVIMVTGVPGTLVDNQRNAGADAVWKKHPGINVVNRYTGMWDSSVGERNTASVLPTLPKIDGIWCQGGTDGVLKAFLQAGRTPLPPTAGEAENGFRKFMVGYMGQKVDGLSIGQPPFLSLVALELAREILQGKHPKKDVNLPFPTVTSDTVKTGETVFPDLPDSFFDDFTDSGAHAVLKTCVGAAQHGKPCSGTLNVKLPASA